MYRKEKVYAGVEEFSFEEIRDEIYRKKRREGIRSKNYKETSRIAKCQYFKSFEGECTDNFQRLLYLASYG